MQFRILRLCKTFLRAVGLIRQLQVNLMRSFTAVIVFRKFRNPIVEQVINNI